MVRVAREDNGADLIMVADPIQEAASLKRDIKPYKYYI
jgi:hypothetical protein